MVSHGGKFKKTSIFVWGIIFFLCLMPMSFAEPVTKNDLVNVLPGANVFVENTEPFRHYLGYTAAGGHFVGVVFITTEVVPEETLGYRSRIATLVGVNASGKISGVKILEEDETPRYTRGLLNDGSWFLTQFIGKDVGDNFLLGRDVDAITGATISSSAIARAIEAGLNVITDKVLYLEPDKESVVEHLLLHHLLWQIDFIFLWIITAIAVLAFLKKNRPLRYLILGFSIVYIGFLKGGGFSINDVLNLAYFNLPVFLNNLYWYSLVVIAIGLTVIAGRFYCGWLCPFGAVLEILYHLVSVKLTVPENADKYLKLIKYMNFVILLMIAFLFLNKSLTAYIASIIEPFATFFRLYGDLFAWMLLISMLLISAVISRFYCRYFCPLGAFFALLTLALSFLKLRQLSVKLPQDNCKGCRIAQKTCQMEAISYDMELKKPEIDHKECFMCNTCAGICPVETNSNIQENRLRR